MTKQARGARRNGPKGSGLQHAYTELCEQILHLDLPPGANLDEVAFARTLGLSRTPVRQAFIQLRAEGLIELLPNRGARVTPVDLPQVREFFEAFDLAQRAASHWAALRRSDMALAVIDRHRLAFEAAARRLDTRDMMDTNLRFHAAIGEACGNAFFAEHYARLLTLALRLSRIALAYEGRDAATRRSHIDAIVAEHRQMAALIRDGHGQAAERVAHDHSELFRGRVVEYLLNDPTAAISVQPPQQSGGTAISDVPLVGLSNRPGST